MSMKKRIGLWIVAICSVGLYQCAFAQEPSFHTQTWNWLDEKWTGSDVPYKEAASKVNLQIAQGKELDKTYKALVESAKKRPADPMSQFRRAYFLVSADWGQRLNLAAVKSSPSVELFWAWNGLVKATSPRCREYSRIRLLINHKELPQPQLLRMTKRLYESDPKDKGAKYAYVDLLKRTRILDDVLKALKLAEEMRNERPSVPHYHSLVGACHMHLWIILRNKDAPRSQRELVKAIRGYEMAVNASTDPEFDRQINEIILSLRKKLKP